MAAIFVSPGFLLDFLWEVPTLRQYNRITIIPASKRTNATPQITINIKSNLLNSPVGDGVVFLIDSVFPPPDPIPAEEKECWGSFGGCDTTTLTMFDIFPDLKNQITPNINSGFNYIKHFESEAKAF